MDQVVIPPVVDQAPQEPHGMDEAQTSLEGLLFFTTRRVVKRLERATAERNENKTRNYMQSITWLGNMIATLPGNAEERQGMIQSLTGE